MILQTLYEVYSLRLPVFIITTHVWWYFNKLSVLANWWNSCYFMPYNFNMHYRGICDVHQEKCRAITGQNFYKLVSVFGTMMTINTELLKSPHSHHTRLCTPNHNTDHLLGWRAYVLFGDSASYVILWFPTQTTWLSSGKISLSYWSFTFCLFLPLH